MKKNLLQANSARVLKLQSKFRALPELSFGNHLFCQCVRSLSKGSKFSSLSCLKIWAAGIIDAQSLKPNFLSLKK